jgi:hypothetical protein
MRMLPFDSSQELRTRSRKIFSTWAAIEIFFSWARGGRRRRFSQNGTGLFPERTNGASCNDEKTIRVLRWAAWQFLGGAYTVRYTNRDSCPRQTASAV